MNIAVRAARLGDRMITILAAILMILLMSYGGFSLWYTYMTMQEGFLNNDLMSLKPVVSEDGSLSFEELLALNKDTRAWITLDGTNIDYPMVQGKDDMEYVNKDVEGNFSLSGSIFMSYHNAPDFSDPYILTYGHHMDNGGMYGDVMEFIDDGYFEEHKTGTLYLPGKARQLEVFACMEGDAYDPYIYNVMDKQGNMREFLDYIKNNAQQYRDIGMKDTDQVISLSTCVSASTNGRMIVFARINP
jgi:sortase, srtB family